MDFIPFPDVKIISSENDIIKFDVHHFRYENLIEGCYRVAEQYRYKEACKVRFYIIFKNKYLLDNKGNKVLV
jgi:hypothetical protein